MPNLRTRIRGTDHAGGARGGAAGASSGTGAAIEGAGDSKARGARRKMGGSGGTGSRLGGGAGDRSVAVTSGKQTCSATANRGENCTGASSPNGAASATQS